MPQPSALAGGPDPAAVGGITDVISDAGQPLGQSASDSPVSSLPLAPRPGFEPRWRPTPFFRGLEEYSLVCTLRPQVAARA